MIPHTLVQADGATISLYCHDLPPLIENELVDSYDMLQSSMPFFRVFRSLENACCYVARHDGHASTVLVFTCRGRRVEVLNEMIEIAQPELDRFAAAIFTTFKTADVITFKALKTATRGFRFPVQRHHSKDTFVITLPATPEEYTSSLGKSTRANVRQQTNGLLRNFPSFEARFLTDGDIKDEHIRAIIGFSELKIRASGVNFSYDVERITRLAGACGFVSLFLVDGRICAGSINYRVGSSYFGEVTGYDPHYEKHGFGKLCVHQTICESIVRGGKKFYLGGGVFDFKQRMLGAVLSMDEVHIYRSRFKKLMNVDKVAKVVAVAYVRRLKRMLQQHKQERWAKAIFKSAYFVKNKLTK